MAKAICWAASLIVAVTLTLPDSVTPSKVLFMPFPHHSHVNYFGIQANALAENGHEVWLLTIERFRKLVVRQPKVNPLLFDASEGADFHGLIEKLMERSPSGEGVMEEFSGKADGMICQYCEEMMSNKEVMTTVEQNNFDLVIIDPIPGITCPYLLPYKFGIPHITVFGFQVTSWVAGITGMPSVEPEVSTLLSNRMSFWERFRNLQHWMEMTTDAHSDANSKRLMDKYIPPHKPRIGFDDVMRQSEMFLLNFEIMCLDYPRASAPNYQFIGGSSATPAKPLSDDLEQFVQGAEHGVVIMTLGSLKAWHSVWRLIKDKFFEAFGRLDQRVIVHYSLPDKVNIPDNVRVMKWLPQNDLLGHPKTRLFITHGGNNGANEAVYHAVPMMVVPITADQPYSGIRVESHGYGKLVRDKLAITADELYDMMREIVENKTYSQNIKKCSEIVRSLPSAQEKFVFWVNHILEFGGAHLRPPGIDMPLYQLLMLDIVAFFVGIALAVIIVGIILCYIVYRRIFRGGKAKKD